MEKPDIKIGEIIKIGDGITRQKAQVVDVYSEEDKKTGVFGNLAVVYYQNRIKGIKEDVVWDGQYWQFKNKGPCGSYVNIDNYPDLKK